MRPRSPEPRQAELDASPGSLPLWGSAGSSSLRSEGLSKSREIEAKNGARQSSSALGFLTSRREFFGQGWMKLEKNERTPYIMKTTKHFNDVSLGGPGGSAFLSRVLLRQDPRGAGCVAGVLISHPPLAHVVDTRRRRLRGQMPGVSLMSVWPGGRHVPATSPRPRPLQQGAPSAPGLARAPRAPGLARAPRAL